MIVVLYKSCFTNSVKGIGIFNFAISAWILNGGCDFASWIIYSLVTVVWVGLSSFSTTVFSFSVCVSTALIFLVFFSGIVWEAVDVFAYFAFSEIVLAVAVFGSSDSGLAVGVLESKIVVLAKFIVFTTEYFCESVDV